MDQHLIIQIEQYVREKLGNEFSGHDEYHSFRVRDTAISLANEEGNCNLKIVQAAALLHDIPDPKICKNIEQTNKEIDLFLQKIGFQQSEIQQIFEIIQTLSFKGANVKTPMKTIEGKVVQDADRLDAIGAIGIARCFAYGGSVQHKLYDPQEKPELHLSEESYRSNTHCSISHFYEKLLLLKDMMQTESGKKVAIHRHKYMEQFLSEFYTEWSGKDLDVCKKK